MHHIIETIAGVIASGVAGAYMGNFATNPIYRLPRDEPLFLKDPYCGDCNHKLVRKDLYPVLSWLLARGKCSYCGAAIPGGYALTEAFIGLLFILSFFEYGFTDKFILVSLGLITYVMLSMMLYIDKFFSNKTVVACLVFGMLYRTLLDGNIFDSAGGGFAGLMIGAAVWKFSGAPLIRDVKAFPGYMKLLVCAGVWLELPLFGIVLLLSAAMASRSGRVTGQIKALWVEQAIIVSSALLLMLKPFFTHIVH